MRSRISVLVLLACCANLVWSGAIALAQTTTSRNAPYEQVGTDRIPWVWMKNAPSCKAVRYASTGDKAVKASAGALCGFLAATGTSVTVIVYDNAGATCNTGGTQVSGTITLTNGRYEPFPGDLANGICVTVGGTNPDITVFYR